LKRANRSGKKREEPEQAAMETLSVTIIAAKAAKRLSRPEVDLL